jgi:hypothetical protein
MGCLPSTLTKEKIQKNKKTTIVNDRKLASSKDKKAKNRN